MFVPHNLFESWAVERATGCTAHASRFTPVCSLCVSYDLYDSDWNNLGLHGSEPTSSGSEKGLYLSCIDFCITQLQA